MPKLSVERYSPCCHGHWAFPQATAAEARLKATRMRWERAVDRNADWRGGRNAFARAAEKLAGACAACLKGGHRRRHRRGSRVGQASACHRYSLQPVSDCRLMTGSRGDASRVRGCCGHFAFRASDASAVASRAHAGSTGPRSRLAGGAHPAPQSSQPARHEGSVRSAGCRLIPDRSLFPGSAMRSLSRPASMTVTASGKQPSEARLQPRSLWTFRSSLAGCRLHSDTTTGLNRSSRISGLD